MWARPGAGLAAAGWRRLVRGRLAAAPFSTTAARPARLQWLMPEHFPGLSAATAEEIRRTVTAVRTGAAPADPRLLVSPRAMFSNTEVDMSTINLVGFDYDFTLCSYTGELSRLIYDQAKTYLVEGFRYPEAVRSFTFDPSFAVRGLMFDTERGLLLKMSYLNALTVVFRGRTRLTEKEVLAAYDGVLHVSPDYRDRSMRGMVDLFSLSEASLLADTIQYFRERDIPYEPRSVYEDINDAIEHVHGTQLMHNAVRADLPRYLQRSEELPRLLQRLRESGKQLFLLTNSPFSYVNDGLRYLIGPDWRDLFDLILTDGRKPGCVRIGVPAGDGRAIAPAQQRCRGASVGAAATAQVLHRRAAVSQAGPAHGQHHL